jgi:SAM-dependent methyltransferase
VDFYHWTIRNLIPRVEYHQNRYARALESVRAARWLDIGAGSRLHGGWLTRSQQDVAAEAGYLIGCDLEVDGMSRNPFLGGAVLADARRLPFAEASFDLVTANMVLEHLEDPEAVFREVSRVLVTGGQFIFITPNKRHPAVWFASSAVKPGRRTELAQHYEGRRLPTIFPTHYKANSVSDIAGLAARARLRVVELEVFSSFPLFRRPAVVTFVEALWIRLAMAFRPLRPFGSNLIGRLEKPPAVSSSAALPRPLP